MTTTLLSTTTIRQKSLALNEVSVRLSHLNVGVDGEVLLSALGEIVDASVLDDRSEHEEETHQQEDVQSGGIGDLRNASATSQSQRTRCQQRRYSYTTKKSRIYATGQFADKSSSRQSICRLEM